MRRREFLKASAGAAALATLPGCSDEARWHASAYRKARRSPVAVLAENGYDRPLLDTVLRGLRLFRLDVRDKRVVLKPNLVEFDPTGVINTHPAVIGATIEAFRTLGAKEVIVAEGPGHRRDNEYLLSAAGIGDMLADTGTPYVDLNMDSVREVRLASWFSDLGTLYLPETVLDADLLVSMPKMKTHHWAGATLSLKNLFGIVPGSIYGWPKNLLHWAGIHECIVDINAAVTMPRFNIVDGILGMEGNGPIQGEPKRSGVLVMGADPATVDATCARLMGIDPAKIPYLTKADAFLGNVLEERIDQIGEAPDRYRQDYRLIEPYERFRMPERATAS